jgi:hypothetical protein
VGDMVVGCGMMGWVLFILGTCDELEKEKRIGLNSTLPQLEKNKE